MFIHIDSKVYRFLSALGDCAILSVLWFLFSLPVVTLGASSCALYYCVVKVIREDQGATLRRFWEAFRSNLKQGTIVTVCVVPVVLALPAVGAVVSEWVSAQVWNILVLLSLLLVGSCISVLHYLISSIARFENTLGNLLKNSLLLCLANLPVSIALVFLFLIVAGLWILTLPASGFLVFFIPALYALVTGFLLERIYRKYIPREEQSTDLTI